MKKHNFSRGKVIGFTAIGLASLSLVGVGFSAWVITAQTQTAAVDNITVEVANVENQTVSIDGAKLDASNNSIRFDASSGDTEGLIHWDKTNSEDLSFAVEFSVNLSGGKAFNGISVVASEATSKLGGWISNNYVAAPFKVDTPDPVNYVNLVDSTWTSNGTHEVSLSAGVSKAKAHLAGEGYATVNVTKNVDVITYKVTFNFAWGSAFGNMNPSLYDDSDEHANASKTALESFAASGQSASFKLTLKHDSNKVTIPNA